MASLKEMAVGRGKETLVFELDKLEEMPGYNTRDMESPETIAHIQMADAIKDSGNAGFPPITVAQKDGKIYVYQGHCRLRAHKLAASEGAPIKGILAMVDSRKDEDKTLDLLTSNNGLPLTQLEKAKAVERLLNFSWTQADIARKMGVSETYVGNLVVLVNAPEPVKEMVASGKVSATTAIAEVKKQGERAAESLGEAVEQADKVGRKKVTARDIPKKKKVDPKKLIVALKDIYSMVADPEADTYVNLKEDIASVALAAVEEAGETVAAEPLGE